MKIAFGILLISLPVILTGCRAAVGTVERAQPVGAPQVVDDKRIIPDASLRKKIDIVQVNEGVVSGNLTKVQVVLANKKSSRVTINYAWEWYDGNGMIVNSTGSAWKSLPLGGSERTAITAIGPNPQAVDFVLKLKEPLPLLKRNDLNPFNP
jgi:uncharacterized protein YcfL